MHEAGSVEEPTASERDQAESPALRSGWRTSPDATRFDPARLDYETALAAHRRAVERGDIGYLDPTTGLFVMTAVYLRDRGWCCDRGCRHCPYVGAGETTEESTTDERSHPDHP